MSIFSGKFICDKSLKQDLNKSGLVWSNQPQRMITKTPHVTSDKWQEAKASPLNQVILDFRQRKMDKTAIKISKLHDRSSDFQYWQTQPMVARLEALQKIREEYSGWKNDHRQEFQRVYRVIKQK